MKPQDEKLEHLLDGALASYGDVEPLAGMEERVLGRLEEPQPQRRPWWIWAAATAALALIVLAAVWSARPREKAPDAVKQEAPRPAIYPPDRPQVVATPQRHAPPRAVRHHEPVQPVVANNEPRLATFPAPSTPTEQERLLLRYARLTSREEVVQMAEANTLPPLPKLEAARQDFEGTEQH